MFKGEVAESVGQGKPVKCYNCNGVGHIAKNCTQPKRPQNSDYFKDKMLLMQAQENGAVLDEEEYFSGWCECEAFDSDVRILENAIDHSVSNQDEHKIHNKVQPSNVIDSTSVHMGNSNLIPYEQYLSVNDISVVPSCASSALNSVCVSPVNDAIVPHDPIAIELKIYKEQVAIYEQRAKFELTERQHQMDDQMRQKGPTALYDGDELLKPHHVPVMVPSSEEELELAEAIGIQKSLVTEVRAMKAIFENLEAEVDQNETDLRSGEIEWKKLLIANENLYQNLKERFGNKHPVTSSDALSFDSLFVIGKLNEHIQSRCNTIRELKEKISRLTKNNSDTDPTFDLKALVSQNKDLTAKLNALHDLKECFRSDITHKLGLSQLD
ncbi:integrase, catalytic region, zinc finger, CCHC-type containing protein [Tanacetum coccineum]